MDEVKSKFHLDYDTVVLLSLSLTYIVIHLIFINQYNYFRDELYYIACGNHLSFGYVDQPPFVAIIAFISTRVFGESMLAIRIFSVMAGGLTVFITGKMTKQLGGSVFSQSLAALMVMFAPVYLFLFHILSMNSFDVLFWTILIYILVKIITAENPKLWLWFGLWVGIGFENKISILFLLFGLGIGLILTPNRKYLKNKYFWFGSIIAFLISLPYLIWEIVNKFPTIEFMRNASTLKNAPLSPAGFLKEQILDMNAVSFILMLTALYYLFFFKEAKKFRVFGWMYLAIFLFLVSTRSKVYYLAPVFPLVFALGAYSLEKLTQGKWINKLKYAVLTLLLFIGVFSAPLALPVLPVETLISYMNTIGLAPSVGETAKLGVLPQYFADMFGWENMTEEVAKVYQTLATEEQLKCTIYTRNYGEAGAIDFFGKKYGLPHAISPHNSYWHWGYDSTRTEVFIVIGGNKEDREKTFTDVKQVSIINSHYAMPYETNLPIYICRGLKVDLKELWKRLRFYI